MRIPEVFAPYAENILAALEPEKITRLGADYYLIKIAQPKLLQQSPYRLFISWKLPVQHSWPCNPQKMEGFIEKAARTLAGKFAGQQPQTILVGQLQPHPPNQYFKNLASSLRGRLLQIWAEEAAFATGDETEPSDFTAEKQDSNRASLFCLIGREGLFAGVATPRETDGFHAGGSKFIKQEEGQTISRAGAKLAEALHYLKLYRAEIPTGSRWLELGASPGGMTSELLARGYKVTAVDRAPLDQRLNGKPGLSYVKSDAASFSPPASFRYEAILSDLNGSPVDAIKAVTHLTEYLHDKGVVIFTLKAPGAEDPDAILELLDAVTTTAQHHDLFLLAARHLTYNRHEFTLFFEKRDTQSA